MNDTSEHVEEDEVDPIVASTFGYFWEYAERDIARMHDEREELGSVIARDNSFCLYEMDVEPRVTGYRVKRVSLGVDLTWIGAKDGAWVDLEEHR